MELFFSVVAVLLMFVVVVGLHEAGHALVAAWCGVKIQRIALGFGKAIYSKTDKHGIVWVLGLWPLGGYVHLLNTRIQAVSPRHYQYCFDKQSLLKRVLILLAGGAVNFLVAICAYTVVFCVGYQQYSPRIEAVIPESRAALAGFHVGDTLLAINNKPVNSWHKAGLSLITELGNPNLSVKVMTDKKQTRSLHFDLRELDFSRTKGTLFNRLGVKPQLDAKTLEWVPSQSFFSALTQALFEVYSFCVFYCLIIKQFMLGLLPISLLLGPLGLLALTIHTFMQGFSAFMSFLGLLSIAVGFVNYLPIPGLDGGSIVYLMLEKVRGKPLPVAMEVLLYRLAMIAFFVFFMQLILNDVMWYMLHP